jgi:ornithine cyclodeaminase/alanine dehydrogenase-like protein (mu-crystallin family)
MVAVARWEGIVELHSIVTGAARGRNSEEGITLFKSNGIALWDVAVAGYVYRQAVENGRGRKMELW